MDQQNNSLIISETVVQILPDIQTAAVRIGSRTRLRSDVVVVQVICHAGPDGGDQWVQSWGGVAKLGKVRPQSAHTPSHHVRVIRGKDDGGNAGHAE